MCFGNVSKSSFLVRIFCLSEEPPKISPKTLLPRNSSKTFFFKMKLRPDSLKNLGFSFWCLGNPFLSQLFWCTFCPLKNLAVLVSSGRELHQVGATYRLCCFLSISALIVVGLTKGKALKVRRVEGVFMGVDGTFHVGDEITYIYIF